MMSWSNWAVRVYAAEAWVSIAQRFAAEHPTIVDHLEMILADPVPEVRFQAARNLQVICIAAPERMWAMGHRIAAQETDIDVLASYLSDSMRRFSHSDPERCEAVLTIVKGRLNGDIALNQEGRDLLHESLGGWAAQLFAGQGRPLLRNWLGEWAENPERYGALLDSFTSSLRDAFFYRYATRVEAEACAMCDRAQEGLALILRRATAISAESSAILASNSAAAEKEAAGKLYLAAEKRIHHAMNQLYFGSGAFADDHESDVGLSDAIAMQRFLTDYSEELSLLGVSREPATLHHLIELYEFLIPGDPVTVFEAIHAILLGRGGQEGYHYESLANTAIVRIVQHYLADYRAIFEDEGRRARLIAILQLFSEVGWTDALKLLYDLPDLLR